jgi:hypothetical protein
MAAYNDSIENNPLGREPADLNTETLRAQESSLPSDASSGNGADIDRARESQSHGSDNPSMWRGALRSLGGIGIERPPIEGDPRASQGQSHLLLQARRLTTTILQLYAAREIPFVKYQHLH